jgi:RHS repeat-associated protein
LASLLCAAPLNAAPPPMLLPGQMDVTPTGAFTYSVPITVPPGTAGMVPSLSLEYSSQSGDGIMGLGWSLVGLPSIGRCPRTIAQDAVKGSVNYDANDKFCMDGQRLVVISGNYGADGAEYRTNIDGHSKIISYGTAGSGPAYFKVWTKSGQIMEFGNTTDSRILAAGLTTARSWGVNKISDTKGNYLTVTYTIAPLEGQINIGLVYPARIDYTGNVGAGLAPYNSVRFTYNTARPDQVPLYHAGSQQKTTVLLTNVKTYEGNNVVRDYQIAYELGTTLRRSRITQIKLCDASGSCLAPTTFGWQGTRDTITVTTTTPTLSQNYNLLAGDFNGDGLTDPLTVDTRCSTTSWGTIYHGTQANTFATTNYSMWPYSGPPTSTPFCAALTPQSGIRSIAGASDFDGDGLTDWLTSEPGTSVYSNAYFSNGASALVGVVMTPPWPDPQYVYLGDFNGDGRSDFFHRALNGTTGTFYTSTGQNSAASFTAGAAQSGFSGTIYSTADFDGNGCSDIMQQGAVNNIVLSCAPAVASYSVTNWTHSNIRLRYGDFNGDGKTDLLETNTDYAGGGLYLSTGIGYAAPSWTTPTPWGKYSIYAADFNGDGRSDIVLIGYRHLVGRGIWATKNHEIWLSTGTGFVQASTITNTSTASSNTAVVADWNNDGKDDIWFKAATGDRLYTLAHTPEFMNSVSNGLGITTTVTYDRINKPTVYTKDTNATYPQADVNGPLYIVTRVDSGNGIGGTYSSTYNYVGLKADNIGRGFLGFRQQSVTDLQTNVVQTTIFRQDFPFTGLVASQTKTRLGVTLNSTTNTYTSSSLDGRYFVRLTQNVQASTDLNGAAIPTVTTSYQYDSFGNPTQVSVTTPDGTSKVTNSTYSNDTTNWLLGRLLTANQINTVGGTAVTRQTSYAYDAVSGLLTQEVVEPDAPTLRLQADYAYDAFGNKTGATVSGTGVLTRTSTTGFDAQGRFATSFTNALGQSASQAFDPRHGGTTSTTDLNGLIGTSTYDAFGRPVLSTNPDGTKVGAAFAYCSGVNGGAATCVADGKFVVTSTPYAANGTTQIGPQGKTYYDALARPIAQDTQGFDGALIRTATQYDAFGRVAQVSRPYFVTGGTPKWIVNSYDAIGRVVNIAQPNGGNTATVYNGLSTTVTNALNQTTTTVKNSQGHIASVADNAGTTTYTYDQFDNVKTITDSAGNVTTFTYDVRGRKTSANDPDMGLWQYTYNVLGELVSQTDAKNQTSTLTYDKLGRMLTRVEVGLTSTWTYDTGVKGIGKIASDSASNGASHTYTYDTLGRPVTVSTMIDGNSYAMTTTYDANSRADIVTYPSGFAVRNEYTSLGYLSRLLNNATSNALWTANTANAELQITQQTAGNGVVTNRAFDPNTGLTQTIQAGVSNAVANFSFGFNLVGSLTSRGDAINSVTENFTYDNMNRLTQYAIAGGSTKTVGYNALGSITSKSDVGTYAYPTAGSARPHAIGSITGAINTIFTYDANGNMIAGQGRIVTYTSFNMAASITQGSSIVNFTYDAAHERIKQTAPDGTTLYIAGGVERFQATSGLVQWNQYLRAGGQLVGVHFTRSNATQNTRYFVTDHLGSVAVLTDEMGAVVERLSYDAWGKRRYSNGADDAAGTLISQTTKGFTGHEHIGAVGLINMNARVYDPTIGRFMSPDSLVENFYLSQILNRYTYVGNNPLSLTDPSGMCFLGCFWKQDWFQQIVQMVVNFFFHGEDAPLEGIGGLSKETTNAIVAGVINGAISGGTVKSALIGGLQNFGISQIHFLKQEYDIPNGSGVAVALHGLVGGLASYANSGNFSSGFLAAGMGELSSLVGARDVVSGLVVSAIAGGIGAELGGGKFGNGALTAAAGYLFNDALTVGLEWEVPDWIRQIFCGKGPVMCSNSYEFGIAIAYPGWTGSEGWPMHPDGHTSLFDPEGYDIGIYGSFGFGGTVNVDLPSLPKSFNDTLRRIAPSGELGHSSGGFDRLSGWAKSATGDAAFISVGGVFTESGNGRNYVPGLGTPYGNSVKVGIRGLGATAGSSYTCIQSVRGTFGC